MTPQLPLKQKHPTGFSSVSRLFPDWHAPAAPSCRMPALLRVEPCNLAAGLVGKARNPRVCAVEGEGESTTGHVERGFCAGDASP